MGAVWASYEEIMGEAMGRDLLKLRGNEPRIWAQHLKEKKAIFPLSILDEVAGICKR